MKVVNVGVFDTDGVRVRDIPSLIDTFPEIAAAAREASTMLVIFQPGNGTRYTILFTCLEQALTKSLGYGDMVGYSATHVTGDSNPTVIFTHVPQPYEMMRDERRSLGLVSMDEASLVATLLQVLSLAYMEVLKGLGVRL